MAQNMIAMLGPRYTHHGQRIHGHVCGELWALWETWRNFRYGCSRVSWVIDSSGDGKTSIAKNGLF
jgi:hypothetical protein